MSLLVWLPLTQDLRNNGIDNSTFSIVGSNTTVNNSGKLGKCYTNNSHSGGGLISNKTIDLGQKQSMFCWFKFSDLESSSSLGGGLVSAHRYGSNSGMGITIKYVSATTGYLSVNTGTGSARTYNTYTGTTLLQANTWYHGGYTYDGSTLKIYVNGVCEKTQAISNMSVPADYITVFCWSLASGASIHGDYKFYGDINDVRVYNHTLSEKEIKELSKGLVLHYPLSNSGDGADNILPGTVQNETTYAYPTSSYNDKWTKKTAIIPSASTYTLSFYAKSTVNGDKIRAHYYNPNTTVRGESSQGAVSTSSDGNITFTLSTDWQKYWVTYAQNATTATKTVIFPRMGSTASHPDMSGTGIVSIKNVKFEEGNKSTVWKPNSTDPAYTSLNYNSTIEYDTSGNGYNGTKSGTITNSTDTSRNSICTTFASGSHIAATINPTGYANSYTFSWWGKYTNYSGHMMWGFANGNRLNLYMSSGNFYWNTGDGNNNPFNVSAATYGDGSWHHFAISGDGTTTKLYIDGEFKANAKTYKGVTGTSLYFNGWDSSTSYNFSGSLSDFRLYATALSADDIKELYQTASSIDKSGNLFGYEFVEV